MGRTKQPAKRGPLREASASTGDGTRRHRPGTVALRGIRKYHKSWNLLIPDAPFIRVVKEISFREAPSITRWQAEALVALQEAAEEYIVQLFEEALLSSVHAKLCRPTASQEAKYRNFLLARESENFVGFNSEQFSSSPDPTPSEPTGIGMVSPPGSISSARQQAEDDAVFHTPPEHHLPANFSSEDQNVDELYSGGARIVDVGDRYHRSKKARVSEAGLDDMLESKRIRDPGEEFGGETVPALNMEVIVDETEGNEGVHDKAEVIVLDSGEEMAALDLADDSRETVIGKIDLLRKSCELSKDGVPNVNGINGDHKCEPMEDILVNKGSEMGLESGVGGSDKVAKDGKRIEKIDEFGYVGGGDSRRGQEEKTGRAASGLDRRRQLPVSLEGIGKNAVETVEPKSGLLDFLDVLKAVVRDMDGGCKDDDFLGTAKSRGMTFPRPRWWPAEGYD